MAQFIVQNFGVKDPTERSGSWLCGHAWGSLVLLADGSAMPCCRYENPWRLDSKGNPMEAEPFLRLREEMLRGGKPKGCAKCVQEESSGIRSKRQRSGRLFPGGAEDEPLLQAGPPVDIEIHLGNLCNLRCIMCSPSRSTAWNRDALAAGYETVEDGGVELPMVRKLLPMVRRIRLHGGETFLAPQLEEILSVIVEGGRAPETEILIHTNLTVFPSLRLRKMLEVFQKVEISCSVDGVGDRNEYIRFPSKWKTVEANFKRFKEWRSQAQNLDLNLVTTLSSYSFGGLPALLEWWLGQTAGEKDGFPEKNLWIIPVTTPEFQSVHALARPVRERIANQILSSERIGFLKAREACAYALAEDREDQRPILLKWTERLDLARNVCARDAAPEIYEI